jgi:hypothetical protein
MTMLANVYSTYRATGNREDLTDFISNISPLEAPMYDRIGTVAARARLHEWQCDSLAAAAANANLEGDTFEAGVRTATTRYTNHLQIMTKQFTVSDTQNVVDKAGRNNETAYQITKASRELKRDFEFTLWDTAAIGSGGSGTLVGSAGTRMRNVFSWQVSCDVTSGGAAKLTATPTCVMSESEFNTGLQNIWNQGGEPNTVYVNGPLKRLISSWATSTARVWDGSKKITNTANVYESDFGVVETILNRYVPSNMVFVIDDNLYKKAVLVPVKAVPMAKRGLGTDSMLWCQWTIEARNPSGSGFTYSAPA